MTLRLKDIYDGLIEQEAQVKLATIQEHWGEDQERMSLLSESLDLVKEAQDKGQIPALNPSEALSVAAELVDQAVLEKEAEEAYGVGQEVADLLKEVGIGPDEIDKIASDEDSEEFGRFCARLYMTAQTGEDHLGLNE